MPGTDTYLGLRAFVDELVRCGLRDAITSPGSRSTPLVLTLAREPRLRATSHLDERSAAFFALGLAKATGIPAVLACTSGTAAANYAPAVIEAHEARVPLLVLTATARPSCATSARGRRSTRSSSSAAPPSGTSRSTTTRRSPPACAGCGSSPAGRSTRRSTAGPARCT